jgi:Mg-chelatase subunit ChlD
MAGWIANTDAMIVGLILTLAATLFVATRLRQSEFDNQRLHAKEGMRQSQLGQLQDRVASLGSQRDRLAQSDLARRREIENSAAELGRLRAAFNRQLSVATRLGDENRKLDAENKGLRTSLVEVEGRLKSSSSPAPLAAQPGLHKALVGLKGDLTRVAFVFDTSGSMGHDGRWDHARAVVATWLEHLDIGECVLILFGSDARIYPPDGSLFPVRGPGGAANRKKLLEQFKIAKPEGRTNTLGALELAYRCPGLDTIILFTDGEPNDPHTDNSNQFDPTVAEGIYALCRQHPSIPVNTVGLGNYFKPQLSAFLMRVAQETGGSFLGR